MFEVKARALAPAGQPVVPVVGVAAVQGAAFAHAVFSAQAEGAVVVVLRSKGDTERVAATGASRISCRRSHGVGDTANRVDPGSRVPGADCPPTSGTTGTRGIVLTHGNLAASTDRLIEAMAMDHDIREYIGVPVQYSFGLGRARAIARVGGSYFVPEHGFDPSEIAMMLRDGSINAISAVPTLWRVLLANRDVIGDAGSKVRWIEIGSQAMSVAEKTAMKTLFPEAKIVQHYGLTEASRTTFLHIDSATEAQLASVGQPMPGVEVSISGEGRIRIRGPHVASGYLRDGKFDPLADADGWFVTDDIGRIEQGWLYFDNRADDQINSGGIKLHPGRDRGGDRRGAAWRRGHTYYGGSLTINTRRRNRRRL
ncbi:MAG: acyl--CoA ligase [Sphingomonadales bacterium]|nr:acyl--CoA ligase [Sphingomonadales bacterium]